mgnify:CR=1 FL=1
MIKALIIALFFTILIIIMLVILLFNIMSKFKLVSFKVEQVKPKDSFKKCEHVLLTEYEINVDGFYDVYKKCTRCNYEKKL